MPKLLKRRGAKWSPAADNVLKVPLYDLFGGYEEHLTISIADGTDSPMPSPVSMRLNTVYVAAIYAQMLTHDGPCSFLAIPLSAKCLHSCFYRAIAEETCLDGYPHCLSEIAQHDMSSCV